MSALRHCRPDYPYRWAELNQNDYERQCGEANVMKRPLVRSKTVSDRGEYASTEEFVSYSSANERVCNGLRSCSLRIRKRQNDACLVPFENALQAVQFRKNGYSVGHVA